MTACSLLDVPCHIQGLLFGWVALVPWWGWALAGLVLVGIVWKLARWPGIIALAAGAGFILGRRSKPVETDDIWPHPDKRPTPSKTDTMKGKLKGETAAQWYDRMNGGK